MEWAYPGIGVTASIVVKEMCVDYYKGYSVAGSDNDLLVIRKDYTLHRNSPKPRILKYAKFKVSFQLYLLMTTRVVLIVWSVIRGNIPTYLDYTVSILHAYLQKVLMG